MNLYLNDKSGVAHSIVMYDGQKAETECGVTLRDVAGSPSTRPTGRPCGKCFRSLN